jgi:hypothetical protein
MLFRMEAVFHLTLPLVSLPEAVSRLLEERGMGAQQLDPLANDGPLMGWYRIESLHAEALQETVSALAECSEVDAAYVKPDQGPPA